MFFSKLWLHRNLNFTAFKFCRRNNTKRGPGCFSSMQTCIFVCMVSVLGINKPLSKFVHIFYHATLPWFFFEAQKQTCKPNVPTDDFRNCLQYSLEPVVKLMPIQKNKRHFILQFTILYIKYKSFFLWYHVLKLHRILKLTFLSFP